MSSLYGHVFETIVDFLSGDVGYASECINLKLKRS